MDQMRAFVMFDVDRLVQNVYAIYSDTLKDWTCAFRSLARAEFSSPGKVTAHCRCTLKCQNTSPDALGVVQFGAGCFYFHGNGAK